MKTLHGWEAIGFAQVKGYRLHKHADPIEGARDDLTIEEAEEVARVAPSLIWVELRHEPDAPFGRCKCGAGLTRLGFCSLGCDDPSAEQAARLEWPRHFLGPSASDKEIGP